MENQLQTCFRSLEHQTSEHLARSQATLIMCQKEASNIESCRTSKAQTPHPEEPSLQLLLPHHQGQNTRSSQQA